MRIPITTGMAWKYRKYAHEQSPEDQGRYEFAEQEPKAKKGELWQDRNPQLPWELRAIRQGRSRSPHRFLIEGYLLALYTWGEYNQRERADAKTFRRLHPDHLLTHGWSGNRGTIRGCLESILYW